MGRHIHYRYAIDWRVFAAVFRVWHGNMVTLLFEEMTETKLKALMHNGRFVDMTDLPYAISYTDRPILHSVETNIQGMIELGRKMVDSSGGQFLPESYFENLSQCELVTVRVIVENENQTEE